jgi:hypothetical protein
MAMAPQPTVQPTAAAHRRRLVNTKPKAQVTANGTTNQERASTVNNPGEIRPKRSATATKA